MESKEAFHTTRIALVYFYSNRWKSSMILYDDKICIILYD